MTYKIQHFAVIRNISSISNKIQRLQSCRAERHLVRSGRQQHSVGKVSAPRLHSPSTTLPKTKMVRCFNTTRGWFCVRVRVRVRTCYNRLYASCAGFGKAINHISRSSHIQQPLCLSFTRNPLVNIRVRRIFARKYLFITVNTLSWDGRPS